MPDETMAPPAGDLPPGTLQPLTEEEKAQLAMLQAKQQAANAAIVRQQREDRLAVYGSFVQSVEFTDFWAAFNALDQAMVPTEVSGHIGAIRSGMTGLKNLLGRTG